MHYMGSVRMFKENVEPQKKKKLVFQTLPGFPVIPRVT